MISKIDCRLFIEGIQIPFNTVTINASVNQCSICTIEVAPSEFVRKLLPRSHVLIVFLEDQTWRVLWDGEFRGWGMSKSSSGVSMQITAMDYTNAFGFMTRNIVDNISANTSTYAVLHTGAEFSFSAGGGGTFVGALQEVFKSDTATFADLVLTLIEKIYKGIPYFSYYNDKNKFLTRLASITDNEVQKLLSNTVATDYMTGIINNRFIGNISFDQILNYFLDVAGYCRVPLIAPSAYNGVSPTCLFKPYAYFSTPPACNCLFPDMYHTISGLGIDYLTEPTRIILAAQETITTKNNQGFSPLWMFNESGPHSASFQTNAELMNSFLSEDEINKGIFPYQKDISYEKVLNIKRDDGDFASMKRSMQGYAYYEYVKAKFSHRSCQVSCTFHPFAVVGFPGAIFDNNQSLFGMIEGINHVISADGTAATTISFSHIYPADRTETASERGVLYNPPMPKWVAKEYRPRGCDETYARLFGRNTSGHAALGGDKIKDPNRKTVNPLNDEKYIYDSDQINIAEIASSIFYIQKSLSTGTVTKEEAPLYSGVNANAAFAYEYTRREVMTLSQYMVAMNLGNIDDATLFGSLPTIIGEKSLMYQHPQSFIYTGTGYEPSGLSFARRQDFAKLLQADLINVTGKLGK